MITAYDYDIMGRKTDIKYPEYFNTTDESKKQEYEINYAYDEAGRLQKQWRILNGKEIDNTYKYDGNSNKIYETNEKNLPTTYTYDSMSRVSSVTDPAGNIQSFEYDKAGNNTLKKDAKNYATSFDYDALNRLTKTTNQEGTVTSYKKYDALGDLIKETDAKGYSSGTTDDSRYFKSYTYNLAGKLKTETDEETYAYNQANGSSQVNKSYSYDQYGELVGKSDAYGNTTAYGYDLSGNLKQVTEPDNTITKYDYDKLGNETYMTDGRGKVTSYSYGDFGILGSVTNAEQNTSSYYYVQLRKATN